MPEFYVAFDREGVRYLAILSGQERPPRLHFPDYASLRDTLNSLGHSWQLVNEIEDPEQHLQRSSEWLGKLSAAMELRPAGGLTGRLPIASGGVFADPAYFGAPDDAHHGFDDCGGGCDFGGCDAGDGNGGDA